MQKLLGIWLPPNAASHGGEIDRLMTLMHWLMALLFVGWCVYFIVVLVRFRAGRAAQASYTGARGSISTYVEAGVVLVEVILLVGFAIPAWARWVTPPEPEEDPLRVRVVAEQFAWNVHYPGPDGVFGRSRIELVDSANPIGLDRDDPFAVDDVTTINQLHLPVDRAVSIELSSKDVIHSFFLPQMRVKQDAIPGMAIPVHFKPVVVTPEEALLPACAANKSCWEIACSQLCGLGHYRMRGFYTVHPQAAFNSWMAGQQAELVAEASS